MISAMNPNINPCENFYEYACGLWGDNHPIPEDRNSYGQTSLVNARIGQRLKGKLFCYEKIT